MDCNYSGSSKQRRDFLKAETEKLGMDMPFDFGKNSQLRILKAACTYLKKEKYLSNLRNSRSYVDRFINYEDLTRNEALMGFIVCFTKKSELIYISENAFDYLGFKSIEILLSYDYIYDMTHDQDKANFKNLEDNYLSFTKNNNKFSFYSMLFASKIKRKQTSLTDYKLFKMTGHFDTKTELFIATCTPMLSVANRDTLCSQNSMCFTTAHRLSLSFNDITFNGENLLGYKMSDDKLNEKNLYEILSPESLQTIKERHPQILNNKNSKGHIDTIQLIHKNGYYLDCLINMYYDNKGFILCKYQILSQKDMLEYKSYLTNIKQNWSKFMQEDSNGNISINDFEIESDFEKQQQDSVESPNNFNETDSNDNDLTSVGFSNKNFIIYDEFTTDNASNSNNASNISNNNIKRKSHLKAEKSIELDLENKKFKLLDLELNTIQQVYSKEKEHLKVEPKEESLEACLSSSFKLLTEPIESNDGLFDFSNEELEINNIKEYLEKELSSFYLNPQQQPLEQQQQQLEQQQQQQQQQTSIIPINLDNPNSKVNGFDDVIDLTSSTGSPSSSCYEIKLEDEVEFKTNNIQLNLDKQDQPQLQPQLQQQQENNQFEQIQNQLSTNYEDETYFNNLNDSNNFYSNNLNTNGALLRDNNGKYFYVKNEEVELNQSNEENDLSFNLDLSSCDWLESMQNLAYLQQPNNNNNNINSNNNNNNNNDLIC